VNEFESGGGGAAPFWVLNIMLGSALSFGKKEAAPKRKQPLRFVQKIMLFLRFSSDQLQNSAEKNAKSGEK